MDFLSLAAVLVLLALNAAFVAGEFALVRARRERLEEALQAGRRGARSALEALDDLDETLAICQLGITMASIGIGFLGEPALAAPLEALTGGVLGHAGAVVFGLVISYIIITTVHITAGEQIPKLYALQRPEPVAKALSRPTLLLGRALRPFVWALSALTAAGLRLLRVEPTAAHEDAPPGTAELDALIARSHRQGGLEGNEAGMLAGVIDLHERCAGQVMTPMFEVTSVEEGTPIAQALARSHETGHSRLLVCEAAGSGVGYVHVADLAWQLLTDHSTAPTVGDSTRPLHIVPEAKPLDDLLAEMQRERVTLALVVDEYGKGVGLVTVEDIIEEVVGEVYDETDTDEQPDFVDQLDGSFQVAGQLGLHELVDRDLPDWTDRHDSTIGGLVFSELGRLPAPGDVVLLDGYELQVLAMDDKRVALVSLRPTV